MSTLRKTPVNKLVLLLFASNAIGHFLAPLGVLGSPLIIILMTWIVVSEGKNLNVFVKSIVSYLFIGLNDIGIRLFAGGIHDMEGNGLIILMFFIGLAPASVLLVTSVLKDNKEAPIWVKIVGLLTFILLIFMHFQLFKTLGIEQLSSVN